MAQIIEQKNSAAAKTAAAKTTGVVKTKAEAERKAVAEKDAVDSPSGQQGYEFAEDGAESLSLATLLEETLQESQLKNFSRRIYQLEDGTWFFRVRHRPDIGPFNNPEEAERVLRRHVIDCRMRNAMGVSVNWPRTWSAMRFARRATPKRAAATPGSSAP